MAYDFKFPDVGEGIHEGQLVKWKVKEGDTVKEHDVIAEIETDKAVVQIPSPRSGVILKLYHKEGETVKVGEVLATIGEGGERVSEGPKKSTSVVGEIEEASDTTEMKTCSYCSRKFSTQQVLDAHMVLHKTTESIKAPEVRVTKKYDIYGYVERIPLKGIRKAVAEHMVQAKQHAPHVTHMDEADVTELWSYREKEKVKAEEKGIHLTFLPFIVKALIASLKEYPMLNSTLDEEHEEIVVKKYYNIGVAVETPDGLIVPVVKIADQKSIYDIAKEIESLAESAKSRKVNLADLKGGTFTITNIGVLGGQFATPILNYPEVGILATGRIYDKVTVDEKGKIVARKTLPLSLAFDHRVVDGAYVARFVNALKENLENFSKLTK